MVALSYFELVEGIFWPTLALALYAVLRRNRPKPVPNAIPIPEATAIAVLLLYPILGYATAVCGAGIISPPLRRPGLLRLRPRLRHAHAEPLRPPTAAPRK